MNGFKNRLMKKKNIYFLGIAILLSGCAENIADTDGKKGDENLNSQSTTTFVGGTEKTQEELRSIISGSLVIKYGQPMALVEQPTLRLLHQLPNLNFPGIIHHLQLQCIIRAKMLRAIMELSSPNCNINTRIIQHKG